MLSKLADFLKSKTTIRFIFWVVVVLILILIVFTFGWWPVAFVNGSPVFAFEYRKATDLAYNYFVNYSKSDSDKEDLKEDSKKISLEGLIDEVFIDRKLQSEMKSSELKNKINQQVSQMLSEEETRQLLLDLIRLPEKEVRHYFLEVQAKNQILDGRLRLEGKNLINWLIEQRKKAEVIILLSDIEWTGEGIKFQ
ncbi:MAG: hypothetical protein UV58_C0024G0006 [Candidatus Wolfebacteria bacterium GW2011_GWC1_43_10]|uniref:Uncharacterized protein n=2 Tax=Candidatus Wolfeibacteriota TaxID=1752735 RepID=A0A0G1C6U5_9BACT|nr:MAG: hypothetical protein UV58_C0024G0006 [Candidatus Wolfebacteria bacterium GW2011_GWC1_43_10]KKT22876.1 MAG: hypothetical protein UW08_C0002G0005 [Parcubacteria group bacterium GW2011_GWB1_43_8b]OGM89827.1 MAG: hypothetical protein A2108_02765 [Candidatus Wolfebacteria bacterium GWA1_42_9]